MYVSNSIYFLLLLSGAAIIDQHGASTHDFVPIFISKLGCTESNTRILECTRGVLGRTQCLHSQDVYVRCQGQELVMRPEFVVLPIAWFLDFSILQSRNGGSVIRHI